MSASDPVRLHDEEGEPYTIANPMPVQSALAGPSQPATIADGGHVTFGAMADAAAATDTSSATHISFFKRLLERITILLARLPAALTAGGGFKTSDIGGAALDLIPVGNDAQWAVVATSSTLISAFPGAALPANTEFVKAQVQTAQVSLRVDGQTPTATVGFIYASGDLITMSATEANVARGIRVTGTSATVQLQAYRRPA